MSRPLRSPTWISVFLLSIPLAAQAEEPATESPEEPYELEGIVIEGKLVPASSSPASTTIEVSKEELEKREEDDVHQVLLRVPGVQVRGEDGVGLRPNIGIRGTNPDRSAKVVLMEDGVLLGPAPYSAPAAYYFPIVTRMTAVNVYKGGATVLFGPRAMGGAIDMLTAAIPGDGPSAYADLAVGQYGYFKGHGRAGFGSERTGFLLEGVHLQSSGFKDIDGGGNAGFSKNEFMAKWRYNSAPHARIYQQLDLKFGFSTERSNESYLGLSDEDFRESPYRRYVSSSLDQMNWYRGQFRADYLVMPSDEVEIQLTAYRNQFTRDWFKFDRLGGASASDVLANPDSPTNRIYYDVLSGAENTSGPEDSILHADNYRYYVSQGLMGQIAISKTTGPIEHSIEAGIRYHFDAVNRRHTRYVFSMSGASDEQLGHLVESDQPPYPLAINRGSTHALSAHVIDEMVVERWTFTPGLRVEGVFSNFQDDLEPEMDNAHSQWGIMPGMGIHFSATDDLGFLAGVYRGVGPVAPQGRAPGTTLPKPETSTTFELGGRYSSTASYFELVGFYNRYGNLTANCSQSGGGCESADTGRQFDGGRADVYGLESMLAGDPKAGRFQFPLRATAAITWGRFRNSFESDNPTWGTVEAGDELPYLPQFQGSVSAGITDVDRFSFEASTTIVSASREIAGQGPIPEESRTDPYAILTLLGSVKIVRPLWLYAKASNLFDTAYLVSRRPDGARPGAPRWIQLGLKFEY